MSKAWQNLNLKRTPTKEDLKTKDPGLPAYMVQKIIADNSQGEPAIPTDSEIQEAFKVYIKQFGNIHKKDAEHMRDAWYDACKWALNHMKKEE
jgi:hypothetical protein